MLAMARFSAQGLVALELGDDRPLGGAEMAAEDGCPQHVFELVCDFDHAHQGSSPARARGRRAALAPVKHDSVRCDLDRNEDAALLDVGAEGLILALRHHGNVARPDGSAAR